MTTPTLLATKIQVPPPVPHAVDRPRLLEAVEQTLPHYRLVSVAAPAGYGKSTFLAQWARASKYSVAWLSLEEADDGLERFFRYLLAAWEVVQPDVMETPLAKLLSAPSSDPRRLLTAFVNVAADLPRHTAFVLDDYHLLQDAALQEAMNFLLEHLPPRCHLVLSGRGQPPLPLARYRVRGELLELQAGDLHFSVEESRDFLSKAMGLQLSPAALEKLQAQLEGWPAGLQLVALSLRRGLLQADAVEIDGRQRFVADYLGEEVLAQLLPQWRRFLLDTSILDRLCAPLCAAVTGDGEAKQMLERLEREDLFLVPLDDRRKWFRIHRLFAAFLQETLQRERPQDAAELHRRAARWHLAHELPEQAFQHAVAGQDAGLVMQIFEQHVQAKLIGGEYRLVQRWLEALPQEWFAAYPLLALVRACAFMFTGQLDACLRDVESVERRLRAAPPTDLRVQVAQVHAVRCSIACFQDDLDRAEALADQAFEELPAHETFFRAMIYGSLGDTYRRHRRWDEARECYLALLGFVQEPGNRVQAAHMHGALADLDLRRGRLRDAAGHWSKALAAVEERDNWGRLPLPLTGWIYIRMAGLLYEWNDLAQAREYLAEGLERAELGGDVRALIAGRLLKARLQLRANELEGAAETLAKAHPLLQKAAFAGWPERFQRLQLELWLAQDRLPRALNWAAHQSAECQQDAGAARPPGEEILLALARVLIAKGDPQSLSQALAHLRQLLPGAAGEGRLDVQVEALALQALAQQAHGDIVGAMAALERALRLAQPQGYVRHFADLGLPMARLLQEAHGRGLLPAYTAALLAAFLPAASQATAPPRLPDPLTEREQEVLALLAAGHKNREIAAELVIATGTVKKHTSNIYGKLGVSSRTATAARARKLGLLD